MFGKARAMKTLSGILIGLPPFFFVLMFIYNPLDDWWMPAVFASLSVISAVACLVWAWIIRRRSRPIAWACLGVGVIYLVLLLLMPARKTRRAGAEPVGPGNGAIALLLDVERPWRAVPDLVR